MQYWVDAKRLHDFMELRGMTIDDVEFFESASERRQAIERTLSSGNLPVVDRSGKELLPSTREPS